MIDLNIDFTELDPKGVLSEAGITAKLLQDDQDIILSLSIAAGKTSLPDFRSNTDTDESTEIAPWCRRDEIPEGQENTPFAKAIGLCKQITAIKLEDGFETIGTYAFYNLDNITKIILNGAEWFKGIGTETSKGTKVFALGGNVVNVGLVEVPMGTTLREIVFDIGGGIPDGKAFKAAQTGGPSGGCIPEEHLDTPIDYESLGAIGSMMGSGGLIVMDDTKCMVNLAKFYLGFTVDESCGKCTPCRIGTQRMLEILDRITEGNGEEDDIEKLEKLANTIKKASVCGLGQTAPNPVLSTIKYFRDEYIAHIERKECPAKVCKNLMKYDIEADLCKKCSLCARQCPVNAITGVVGKEPYVIDQDKCIKCGMCISSCKFGAIVKK